jgi:aspartyl-tRNA(Asn)/glutamyl-tRNA(Gln) amidotransferase subunit A
MYLADVWTIPANMAGIPGLALPCGFAHGLPVGLQFFGPAFGEPVVLRAAHAYEQSTDWHRRRPPVDDLLVTS